MSKKPLAIYGAGGLGRELSMWIRLLPEFDFIGFFDDELPKNSLVAGVPVLGGINHVRSYKEINIVIGVGSPEIRMKVSKQLKAIPGVSFPVVVHPRAIIEDTGTVILKEGSVVTAGCVLTTGIVVGRHVLINLNTTIGHDCAIGDCSGIMPGVNISGTVKIGDGVLIGTGASILNNLSIGDHSRIGAGAVVLKSIPSDCTALGVPAKVISK